jgi:hypothetical protein
LDSTFISFIALLWTVPGIPGPAAIECIAVESNRAPRVFVAEGDTWREESWRDHALAYEHCRQKLGIFAIPKGSEPGPFPPQ